MLFSLEIHYIIHQINPTAFQGNSYNVQTRSKVTLKKKKKPTQVPQLYSSQKSCYTRFKRPDKQVQICNCYIRLYSVQYSAYRTDLC